MWQRLVIGGFNVTAIFLTLQNSSMKISAGQSLRICQHLLCLAPGKKGKKPKQKTKKTENLSTVLKWCTHVETHANKAHVFEQNRLTEAYRWFHVWLNKGEGKRTRQSNWGHAIKLRKQCKKAIHIIIRLYMGFFKSWNCIWRQKLIEDRVVWVHSSLRQCKIGMNQQAVKVTAKASTTSG